MLWTYLFLYEFYLVMAVLLISDIFSESDFLDFTFENFRFRRNLTWNSDSYF